MTSRAELLQFRIFSGIPFVRPTCGDKDKRREALGSAKRLLYCVNVNRTSLDHLLLGESADIDEMSHAPSITPGSKKSRRNFAGS
jgi:hypothetical protein